MQKLTGVAHHDCITKGNWHPYYNNKLHCANKIFLQKNPHLCKQNIVGALH